MLRKETRKDKVHRTHFMSSIIWQNIKIKYIIWNDTMKNLCTFIQSREFLGCLSYFFSTTTKTSDRKKMNIWSQDYVKRAAAILLSKTTKLTTQNVEIALKRWSRSIKDVMNGPKEAKGNFYGCCWIAPYFWHIISNDLLIWDARGRWIMEAMVKCHPRDLYIERNLGFSYWSFFSK